MRGQRGESDLCFVKGKLYLLAACDVETPKPMEVEGVLGVDLGIVNIAADSDGQNFSGAEVQRNRRIFEHRSGDDTYITTRNANGKWEPLVNLGPLINGLGDDRSLPSMDAGLQNLPLRLDEGDGFGSLDLWWLYFKDVQGYPLVAVSGSAQVSQP